MIYTIGATKFLYDHWARDLPEDQTAISRPVGESGRRMLVELNGIGYRELLSDARYYAEEMSGAGFDGHALIRSAAAMVKALEKAGPPK